MNIADIIKNEILEGKIQKKCCKYAFLSGVIRGAGSLTVEKDGLGLTVVSNREELVEKAAELLASVGKFAPVITRKDTERSVGSRMVFELYIPPVDAEKILSDLHLTTKDKMPLDNVPEDLLQRDCCRKSYLRGIFEAGGSISIPGGKTDARSYILELQINSPGIAENIVQLLSGFNIDAKTRVKKNCYSVYLKDSEKISDFIAVMGANKAYFELQEILVKRSISNTANRQRNCDMANISRTLDASAKQTAAIELINRKIGINNLEESLKELAKTRLEHPNDSLSGLLLYLSNPPTKSGLNHRMRKLLEIAEELKGETNDD